MTRATGANILADRMTERDGGPGLRGAAALSRLLEIARELSAPLDLREMLSRVIDAGRDVLGADRGTVFLYDPAARELFVEAATGLQTLRFSVDKGIAGETARTRRVINVPDCYADARFNPEADRRTGYVTKCLISVPLVGLEGELVGVVQFLNARSGRFDEEGERIAEALASQAAVAIQRARLVEERIVRLRLEREMALAREIQFGVLPKALPVCPGYGLAAHFRPASETGGDLYDAVTLPGDPRIVLFLADATGHGMAPALSVTQARAMVRVGLAFSDDLDAILDRVNRQLERDLASGRFVTAFLGRLDPRSHSVEYRSPGQGPIVHYSARSGTSRALNASTLPLGILEDLPRKPREPIALEPGDVLALLTDGFYEAADAAGELFGVERVMSRIEAEAGKSAEAILAAIVAETESFTGGAEPADDVTGVVVKRDGETSP